MLELSVHLMTYNNEKTIKETLESILIQKVDFDFEVVVSDDASTDGTYSVMKEYTSKHPGLFKIKQNKNRLGILKNFKETLDRCKGKYVFDIAGDDLLKHDYSLQKMINVLSGDPKLGFINSGFDKYFTKTRKTIYFANKDYLNLSNEEYKTAILLGRLTPAGICFKKEALYKYVDFDRYLDMGITIEDHPILVDLIHNVNFKNIHESLHVYRINHESYSHTEDFERQLFLKNQMRTLFEYFAKKYNYDDQIIYRFHENTNREILHLGAYHEKKEVSKKAFKNLKQKRILDYIYLLVGQSPLLRKLASLF